VHIIELSTAVVKVNINVINASLTQNHCLQCVTPPLTHVEIPIPRDATELNNDGMIKLGNVQYQTERIYQLSERYINDDSSFCLHIRLAVDVQCHDVFPPEKLLLNVRLCLKSALLMTSDVAVLG